MAANVLLVMNLDEHGNQLFENCGSPVCTALDRGQLPSEFADAGDYSYALQPKLGFPGHVLLVPVKDREHHSAESAPARPNMFSSSAPAPTSPNVFSPPAPEPARPKLFNPPFAFNKSKTGASSDCIEVEDLTPANSDDSNLDKYNWSASSTRILISNIEERYDRLGSSSSLKNRLWIEIAKSMQSAGVEVTASQCQRKWCRLKDRYKKVTSENNQSGNGRTEWEFFSSIHAFMYNKADINPVATCSTSSGFKCNAEAKRKLQPSEDDDVQCEKKKQKSKITPQDKRHKENLERKDRFLELFEHLIQKL